MAITSVMYSCAYRETWGVSIGLKFNLKIVHWDEICCPAGSRNSMPYENRHAEGHDREEKRKGCGSIPRASLGYLGELRTAWYEIKKNPITANRIMPRSMPWFAILGVPECSW